jgi:hypothetical protein
MPREEMGTQKNRSAAPAARHRSTFLPFRYTGAAEPVREPQNACLAAGSPGAGLGELAIGACLLRRRTAVRGVELFGRKQSGTIIFRWTPVGATTGIDGGQLVALLAGTGQSITS